MKLSDKMLVIANWLEDENNELLVEAEMDEVLESIADSLVQAASTLRMASEEVKKTEEETLTAEKLEEMAALAEAFDASGDELLVKQASVLDEILSTIAGSNDYAFSLKKAEDDRIDSLKKKYNTAKEDKKTADAVEDIKKSPVYKKSPERHLSHSLSARTCPDHAGEMVARVGEGKYQCGLDGKVYDWNEGFTTLKGDKVIGGTVAEQTPSYDEPGHQIFDTRSQRLNSY